MRRTLIALCLAALASAPCRAGTMSQTELAVLPADVATERLMDQLAFMLGTVPYKPRFHQGDAAQRMELARIATGGARATDLTAEQARTSLPPRLVMLPLPKPATFEGEGDGQLAITVAFVTHARPGAARGVCTLDFLELSLSPQGSHIDPSIQLGVSDFYVFKGYFTLKPDGHATTETRCRALAEGPEIVSPITGPDEAQALEGDRVRRELLGEIEHGDTSFDLDCSATDETQRAACLAALRKMLPEIREVRGCDKNGCTLSHFGDFEDVITVATRGGRVRSVKVHTVKIVID